MAHIFLHVIAIFNSKGRDENVEDGNQEDTNGYCIVDDVGRALLFSFINIHARNDKHKTPSYDLGTETLKQHYSDGMR